LSILSIAALRAEEPWVKTVFWIMDISLSNTIFLNDHMALG
jgi:hypothetical protein